MFLNTALILFLALEASSFPTPASTKKPTLSTDVCKLAISEVRIPATGRAFIEIYQYCLGRKPGPKTTKALRGHKLLLVSSETQNLLMVVDLGHENFKFRDEEKFYVVEPSSSPTGGFIPGAPPVQSVTVDKTKFPIETNQAYGLFLVRSTSTRAKEFKLTRLYGNVYQQRYIDPFMWKVITENIVDFWHICTSATCSKTNPFLPNIGSLRSGWEDAAGFAVSTVSSVNYCGPNGIQYGSAHLMLSQPTPGDPNICHSTRSAILAAIESSTEYSLPAWSTDERPSVGRRFSSAFNPTGLSRTKRRREFNKKLLLEKISNFDDSTMQKCARALPGSSLAARPSIRSWLDVTDSNGTCCFKCKVCEKFFSLGYRPDANKVRKRQKITDKGICSGNPVTNHQAIMDHTSDSVHDEATKLFDKLQLRPSDFDQVTAEYDMEEYILYKPTINMMRLVYTEIVSDTPFGGHAKYVSTLKLMGVNMGFHHFDAPGALAITKTFSEEFHVTMLKHLVAARNPYSLIVDGSHDNANNHLFCVILQTLERNQPVLYFYRLIHLKTGEKSEDIVKSLMEKVDDDERLAPGFREYFLDYLFGMASDGASVMTGVRVSVHAKLKSLTKRRIILSKCMAHSLELSTKRAITAVANGEYLRSMEEKANKVYTYYMSRGSLKWLRLNDVGRTMGVQVKRFKAHYPVRWSSSHHEVMKSLWFNYYVALSDTKKAKEDKSVPAKVRDAAIKIYSLLSNKLFPLFVNELLDYLAVYKELSLELEKSKGTLIGKSQMVKRGLQNLEVLSSNLGPSVSSFLKSCSCEHVSSQSLTLDQYEACRKPKCSGFVLTSSTELKEASFLGSIRGDLYKSSTTQLNDYFELDRLDAYNILDLSKRPEPDDLRKFCDFQGWSSKVCIDFKSQFAKLSDTVRQRDTFRAQLAKESIDTWTSVLDDKSLEYSSFLNETLRGVLSLPVSSADAERVFSMVTKVKSKERSRLTPENLDHIIRVKMNGPKDLDKLDVLDYVRVFLKNHVLSDDASAGMRQKTEHIPDTYLVPSQIF